MVQKNNQYFTVVDKSLSNFSLELFTHSHSISIDQGTHVHCFSLHRHTSSHKQQVENLSVCRGKSSNRRWGVGCWVGGSDDVFSGLCNLLPSSLLSRAQQSQQEPLQLEERVLPASRGSSEEAWWGSQKRRHESSHFRLALDNFCERRRLMRIWHWSSVPPVRCVRRWQTEDVQKSSAPPFVCNKWSRRSHRSSRFSGEKKSCLSCPCKFSLFSYF